MSWRFSLFPNGVPQLPLRHDSNNCYYIIYIYIYRLAYLYVRNDCVWFVDNYTHHDAVSHVYIQFNNIVCNLYLYIVATLLYTAATTWTLIIIIICKHEVPTYYAPINNYIRQYRVYRIFSCIDKY